MINRLGESLLVVVVLISSAVYSLQGQDIDSLEDDLMRMYGYENYSSKIDKARLLLHIDPFNEIAIRYISYFCSTSSGSTRCVQAQALVAYIYP